MSRGNRSNHRPPSQGYTPPKTGNSLVPGAWDSLHIMHRECVAYAQVPTSVYNLLRDKDKTSKIQDQQALASSATILNRDMLAYTQRLAAIQQQHHDRRGDVKDTKELMEAIQIGEQYADWTQSFESVVFPTVSTIHDLFRTIEGVNLPEAITLDPYADTNNSNQP